MSFTAQDARYLARRKRPSRIPAILVLAIPLALFGTMIEMPRVEAQEPAREEVIHQNDYYCEMIRDKGVKVVGAEGSIEELCAKWGVTL